MSSGFLIRKRAAGWRRARWHGHEHVWGGMDEEGGGGGGGRVLQRLKRVGKDDVRRSQAKLPRSLPWGSF